MLQLVPSTPKVNIAAPDAVSYLPVDPPLWACIKSNELGPFVPPMTSPPELIPLNNKSTCCCQPKQTAFNEGQPIASMSCIIYSITEAWSCCIKTQKCPSCIHCCIGPKSSDLSLFNFNNCILFTHKLMNNYTSAFTTSETPFAAYVQGIRQKYVGQQLAHDFVTEKVFIAAWFSFVTLVKLENDMICSSCGPTPKVTIWDGVTLAFNQKHLLSTLHPPTMVNATAPVQDKMKPSSDVCLISNWDLHKML